MSVASEITKLNTNISNAYDEIAIKSGIIPQNKNTDNLPTAIRSIPAGGGADEYFVTSGNITNASRKGNSKSLAAIIPPRSSKIGQREIKKAKLKVTNKKI